MRSLIVGTAGHIDHGKSALVRALTGTDPDRLPEEKRRGITIDLGFADLQLGDLRLGFVDVPGHERFIKNMLAGAHGIDILALVIAADEGVMPQTREHFDICRLLGVREGIVVITKADLVDDEMLLLVEDEAKELVAGSFLSGKPVVSVSARTGSGLDEFKKALQGVAARVSPRESQLATRLPIDRAFSMKGFGPVVTGTLVAGSIAEGEDFELLPPAMPVRVRGVQVHGKSVSRAEAGQRTAVNLGGVDVDKIERGMVLATSGALRPTQIFDAQVTVLPNASRGLRSRMRVRVHLATAEVSGRVRVLDESGEIKPGASGFAQFRLDSPAVGLYGDRFIVRTYSPPETIGGGLLLNPFAEKHRARTLVTTRERLSCLAKGDEEITLRTFVQLSGDGGLGRDRLRAITSWNNERANKLIAEGISRGELVESGGVLLTAEVLKKHGEQILGELERHHQREPLSRGMMRETLRERTFIHLPVELFNAVLQTLEKEQKAVADKDVVKARDHSIDLSARDQLLIDAIERVYLAAAVATPTLEEALSRAGIGNADKAHGRKLLQLLLDSKKLVRIQPDMFMHSNAIADLKAKLLEFASKHEPDRLIDVAEFKELAGVSRKYAIPLLEYFDRERFTRRAGDKRLILK